MPPVSGHELLGQAFVILGALWAGMLALHFIASNARWVLLIVFLMFIAYISNVISAVGQ